MIKALLSEFWKWANVSFDEYRTDETVFYKKYHLVIEEFSFPKWNELLQAAKEQISEGSCSEDVFTVLALDNEREELLDFIEENTTDSQLEALARNAISFPLWNARWQIAEILKRRDTSFSNEYLLLYQKDPVEYVRRRAAFC